MLSDKTFITIADHCMLEITYSLQLIITICQTLYSTITSYWLLKRCCCCRGSLVYNVRLLHAIQLIGPFSFRYDGYNSLILNRCAASWYGVCREFLLETLFKYWNIYCVKFITCNIKLINLKDLFASDLSLPHVRGRLRSVSPSPSLLIDLHSTGCKCKFMKDPSIFKRSFRQSRQE
jgi:hypothetical protein